MLTKEIGRGNIYMEVQTSAGNYKEQDIQALAVAVFKEEKASEGILKELDEASGGILSSIIESEELKGKEGETVYVHLSSSGSLRARRLLLVGVGSREDYKPAQVSQMAGTAVRYPRGKNIQTVALVTRADGDAEKTAAAALEGTSMRLCEMH